MIIKVMTVYRKLIVDMYLNVVTSLSSKNNELHGAPQSLTTFPPILISYPRTDGAFNCTGHINPLKR